MMGLFIAFLVLCGHQVLANPWKTFGNTWRENQQLNSGPEQSSRADRCSANGGTTFSYDGLSYCAKRTCTSWNETKSWCESIGMVMTAPRDPNALATHIHSLSLRCWYWLDGRGDGSNQVWLNGTAISNTDPLWGSSPNTHNDYCLALTICNGLNRTLLTHPCSSGCGYRLCQGVRELPSSPEPSETTSSAAVTSEYVTTSPVAISETTALPSCGGEYNSTSGVIQHPASGGNYQNNQNCIWIIRTTAPFQIVFTRFNTEQGYDFLQLSDTVGNDSHIIGSFHGNRLPMPVHISTNSALLIFTSDHSVVRTGFQLRWGPSGPTYNSSSTLPSETTSSTVPTVTTPPFITYDTTTPFVTTTENVTLTGCGGEFSSTSGVIRHPASGGEYQNNENCTWIIRATHPFNIIFDRFDIEQNWDYLRVRVGEGNASRTIESYTGSGVPSPVRINSNAAYLTFTSDRSVTRTGFQLRWTPAGEPTETSSSPAPMETTSSTSPGMTTSTFPGYDTTSPGLTPETTELPRCGGEFNSTSGVIRHPLSGGNYQNNENCVWIIRASSPLNITFTRFNTEHGFDYLLVRDGEGNGSYLIQHYTGHSIPNPIQINTSLVYLNFRSDHSVIRNGFELHWEPSVPANHSTSPLPSETTSSTVPTVTPTPDITTPFVTTPASGCGGEFNSPSGVIRHPLSGGNYQNNENCIWIIRATEPFNIIFVRFNIEQNYDYLRVRVGEGNGFRIIESYTGSRVPSPVLINTNTASLTFTSDSSVTRTGFQLRWSPAGPAGTPSSPVPTDTTSSTAPIMTTSTFPDYDTTTPGLTPDTTQIPGCGREYSSASGFIRHPLRGGNYQNNEICVWTIRTTQPFDITFINFNTEHRWDYLRIRDGGRSSSNIIQNFTGNTVPSPVHINTNTAYLIFTSDSSVTRSGFLLRWEPSAEGTTELTSPETTPTTETTPSSAPVETTTSLPDTNAQTGCGGEYSSSSGIIRHPSTVGYYPKNENCTWVIRTEGPVNIRFVSFDTEQDYDYLQIRDGSGIGAPIIGQLSGNSLPKAIQTTTSTVQLFFLSDDSVTRTGFVIYWELIETSETTAAIDETSTIMLLEASTAK